MISLILFKTRKKCKKFNKKNNFKRFNVDVIINDIKIKKMILCF